MSDLIERLRLNQGEIFGPTMQEAADEIERLQRENEELRQRLAVEEAHSDKYRCENEELRKKVEFCEDRMVRLDSTIAVLKAKQESTEQWNETMRQKKAWADGKDAEPVAWIEPEGKLTFCQNMLVTERTPLFTTPLTTTALLGSLGDWVYERMQQADSDYHNYGDDTAEVYATLKMVLSKIESMMIKSLPLIKCK